jgi:hypothetical protein
MKPVGMGDFPEEFYGCPRFQMNRSFFPCLMVRKIEIFHYSYPKKIQDACRKDYLL